MKVIMLFLLCLITSGTHAQKIVFDRRVFESIVSNSAVRDGSEIAHNNYLGNINDNLDNININMGSVVLAQTMIYYGLSQVNSALQNGLAVKNMTVLTADMINYLNQVLQMARAEPYLLLFATKIQNEMRLKAVRLVTDVSGYILKEGSNVLADYNSRDEMLKKVTKQLHILNALAYGTWKAMFWAREKGIIASLNPFSAYIYKDKILVQQIIQKAKYLRQ